MKHIDIWLRSGRRLVVAVALGIAGFAAGSAIAVTGVRTIENLGLFEALRPLHHSDAVPIIYEASTDAPKRSFTIEPAAPDKVLSRIAREYGREAVKVGGIYVLERRLPAAVTAEGSLANVKQRLEEEGGLDLLKSFNAETANVGRSLVEGLPRNTAIPLQSLTAAQQQQTLDFLRRQQLYGSVGHLRDLVYGHSGIN